MKMKRMPRRQRDSGRVTGNSPENKRVSRLFSVTTYSAPLSPALRETNS